MLKRDLILYLDDEENNLQAFKAAMRRDFEVLMAKDVLEAKQVLHEHNDLKVLIVDQGLPGISGLDFLESIENSHPLPIRVILTGQTDIQLMIDAINRISLFRFILKPWNNEDLKQTIRTAIEVYDQRLRIREQQLEMRESYEMLNRLVYSASHEMRAPIASAKGLLNLAANEASVDQLHTYMGMIEKSIDKLDAQVGNLIMFHQHANEEVQKAPLHPEDFVQECFDQLSISAGNETSFEMINSLGANTCLVDVRRLKMIAVNLLSNAFKFKMPGQVNHLVKLQFQRDADHLCLKVSDNGSGINLEEINEIFDMFNRGGSGQSGSGMGLYLVKEISEVMGGEIQVHSMPELGSEFILNIPVKWQ